jgi:hypothetical protein
MDGTTARAKAFGDIACSYAGVVGTGNGRGTAVCGSLVTESSKKKDEWDRIQEFAKKNEVELVMFAVLLVAAYDKFGFDEPLPFMVRFNYATDNGYEVMLLAPVADDLDAGVTYDNNGRVMLFGNKRF